MALMRLVAIICLLSTFTEAKPVDQTTFVRFVNNLLTHEKLSELCDFSIQLQNLQHKSKDEKDQEIFKDSLKFINEATRGLDNFDCQLPDVIATLVTTTTTESTTKIIDNGDMIETGTDLTPFKPTTEIEKLEEATESMCDDCGIDYGASDEARDEFTQVLDEVEVMNTGYKPKTIAMLSLIEICGILLLGFVVYTFLKLVSCFF